MRNQLSKAIESRRRIIKTFWTLTKLTALLILLYALLTQAPHAKAYIEDYIHDFKQDILIEINSNNNEQEIKELRRELEEIRGILEGAREVEGTITAYAPLSPSAVRGMDYSGDPSITASGERVEVGVTVAATLPFGTRVYIEGYGMRVVQDRGSAIGWNDFDIAVDTRREAFEEVGRHKARVLIF